MNVFKYCEKIIYSKSLEEKLLDPGLVTCFEFQKTKEIPKRPYRPDNFSFTESKAKFPKPGSLKENKNKIVALQFFANHELLAIEMMASAIILFCKTVNSEDFKTISKGILSTIKDEQKHFRLYIKRVNELGGKTGVASLNDFFWKQLKEMRSFDDFFCVMSLTFEAANLDFAHFYEKVFKGHGDNVTADILKEVYIDELKHVRLGYNNLKKSAKVGELWSYYLSCLPKGITPARSKGICFDVDHRKKVGMDEVFINNLCNFDDGFLITKRKN